MRTEQTSALQWQYTRNKSAKCSKWVCGDNWVTKYDVAKFCHVGVNGKPNLAWMIESPIEARKTVESFLLGDPSGKTSPPVTGSAKLVAVTETRRALSALLVEQSLGLRDDINERAEKLLMALYDAGAAYSAAAQIKP